MIYNELKSVKRLLLLAHADIRFT